MIQDSNQYCKLIYRDKLPSFDVIKNANLSSHYSANPCGDWIGMAFLMKIILDKFDDKQIKILEVGTAHGHFVYSMRQFLKNVGERNVSAYGLDSMLHGYDPRFFIEEGMYFIKGNSTDLTIINSLPNDFHFIFIDCCHCQNHVFLDATNYYSKIRSNGFMGFHDTSPLFQGGTAQPNTPECHKDPSIGVVKGIERFNPDSYKFSLFLEEIPLDKHYGGIRIYESVL
jgi:hypothetical protein